MLHHHFFAYMYRLKHIERWSLMRNTSRENVAEHSFQVSLIVHMLCEIGNHYFDKSYQTDRAVTLALFHDVTEVITGDIPTPVKHHNPRMLSNFREIEGLAAERLLGMIPPDLQKVYAPLLQQNTSHENDQELLQLVKAADMLDAYLKCLSEQSAGNREFHIAMQQTKEKLDALQSQEVNWFLTHLAPSIGKTLDELSD